MIYIIISNIGLAAMMLIVYMRYSKFRITSGSEIKELRKKLDVANEERKAIEGNLLTGTKSESEKVEKLLREVDAMRKEKEGEVKLRLEAEKQVELALQKIEEIQKRMRDWRVVQDAVMKDSKDAIMKVGNDLFKKLSDNYKMEVETNKNLIGRIAKSISDFGEKFHHAPATTSSAVKTTAPTPGGAIGDNKLALDLVNTMKASGHMVNKNYFVPANFDEQKARMFLCEVAFVGGDILYVMDFKACRILEQKNMALDARKQALNKYLLYLQNPKYLESILKVMATTQAKFTEKKIIVVVPQKADLQVLKEIGFYQKCVEAKIEVNEFDQVNNIVI